jgi:hypothetical protein
MPLKLSLPLDKARNVRGSLSGFPRLELGFHIFSKRSRNRGFSVVLGKDTLALILLKMSQEMS